MASRIDSFLRLGREQGCSDIHFAVGLPPLTRQDGHLVPLKYRELTLDEANDLIRELLDERRQARFEEHGSVDLSYASADAGRFRINVCRHLQGVSVFCRVIPDRSPRLADLGLPPILKRLTRLSSGLVLVTGASGTGKSTTLAAMIEEINRERALNVITVEEPIEFVHRPKQSLIVQREVGLHVNTFPDGLRSALRQDPDVVLVGEMRDLETIRLAIEAAETGHLVLAGLRTRGAVEAVDRIVDSFPADAQAQARATLADNLRAVVSQDLVSAADGRGRRAVAEVLVVSSAVAQLIREGRTFQIPGVMASGRRAGMQLLDQALLELVRVGEIDPDEAFLKATDKRELTAHVTRLELLEMVGPPAKEDS